MSTLQAPRIDLPVLDAGGRFSREWYKAIAQTINTTQSGIVNATLYNDTGSVNAMAINSGISAYTTSPTLQRYVRVAHTNTSTAVTLSDSHLAAEPVVLQDGSTLPAVGQITAGSVIQVQFTGAAWAILNLGNGTSTTGDYTVTGNLIVSGTTTLDSAVNLAGGSGTLKIGGAITRFESSEVSPISSALTTYSVAHGGPRVPDITQWVLRCKTAELGYSVGQEVVVTDDAGDNSRHFDAYCDATNMKLTYTSSPAAQPALRAISTGTITGITVADWKLVARAIWL